MDYQVVLSPSARADLRDIVRYISFDAPDRALEFGRFLISRTRLLAQSPQLIALDTRVVGILQKHFAYNFAPSSIQSQRRLYLSLEAALREFSNHQNMSLALLDRILFSFGNITAIELLVKFPKLASRLG